MAGRRVSQKSRGHNPLYYLFMILLALVVVLLITVGILSSKLRKANEQLTQYRTSQTEQTEETEFGASEQTDPEEETERDLPTIDKGVVNRGEEAAKEESETEEQPTQSEQPKTELGKVDWLDLTGHSEIEVAPTSVYKDYEIRYAADGVNLRGGPGTNYSKVKMLDLGTEVAAVAEQGEWTFAGVDGKFGWIKTEYLVKERPQSPQEETPTEEAVPEAESQNQE